MVYIRCKVCESGAVEMRKTYRMSGPVVLLGYMLLVPSLLGVAFSLLLFFGPGAPGRGGLAGWVGGLSLVGGLVGWVLVRKRWVLECNLCNAAGHAF